MDRIAIVWVVGFGLWTLATLILTSSAFGIDARIYSDAARTWLSGGDPWAVRIGDIRFAAPPTSLLPFAPFTGLPAPTIEWLAVIVGLAAVVFIISRTKVGWWWLLSVPALEGIWVGSLDPVALALIVGVTADGRSAWIGGLAPMARLFAFVPLGLLDRRRAIIGGILVLAVTAPFLPWPAYLARLPELVGVLADQSDGGKGATAVPWLILPTVIALLAIGRADGAWLAVPALWPASQLHYGLLALPVGSPVVAAFALSPLPAPLACGVIALALVRALEGKLDPWSWLPERWRPARDTSLAAAARP